MSDQERIINGLTNVRQSLEQVLLELQEVISQAQFMGGEIERIAVERMRGDVASHIEDMLDAADLPYSFESVVNELREVISDGSS